MLFLSSLSETLNTHTQKTQQANSTDAWTIDSSQVECLVNQSCSKLPPNVSGEKRDKWTLSKLYNFREWADRDTCSAVCDAAFAFRSDDSSQEPTKLFKFSLSYIYSKADFFTAVGQWPPGQSNKPPMQITYVEDETTTDPRVLEIIIFWIYTDVLLDVHTLTNGSCKAEDLLALPDQYFLVTKPTIMADMLDVYKVAFMFGMNRLMKKIRKHCFKPSMGCCFQATENKLACLLARCGTTDAEGDVLLHIADSYVKFARGIPCLCRWPLMYSQKKWEILMEAGKSFSHHWFAHVVPLYIHIFMPSASCAEVIALADKYNLDEAAKKSIAMHLQASDMRSSLEFNGLGTFCMERQTSIPHVRSLQRFYKVHYNIDLAEGMGPSKSWVLPWAHMLAACAQIHSTVQEEKLAEISPDWLGKVCMSVLDRYGKTAENEQEEADVCVKRLWLVDRMVLGPLHDTSSVSAFDLAEYACRDMVVLQVSSLFFLFSAFSFAKG